MERSNLIAKTIICKTHVQNIRIPHRTEFYFHTWFGGIEEQDTVAIIKLIRYA